MPYYYEPFSLYQDLSPQIMSLDLLESIFKQLFEHAYDNDEMISVKIIWQGGEPLLVGLDYFEKAVELIKKYAQSRHVEQYLYTNATLFDAQWVKFFKKERITPVLYVQGAEAFYGSDPDNRFSKIYDALELMFQYMVPFRACTAIINSNYTQAEDLYELLSYYTFNMDFYPMTPAMVRECGQEEQYLSEAITPEKYIDFLQRIYDIWGASGRRFVKIQQFNAVMQKLNGNPINLCSADTMCKGYMVVDHKGDVYPCMRSLSASECLGNLNEISLAELFKKCEPFEAQKTYALPERCVKCRYVQWCFCGCPKDRISLQTDKDTLPNYLCESYETFLKKVIFLGEPHT